MKIEEREYNLFDILGFPLKCAPISTALIGLQRLLIGLIPSVQIVVTANFIDTAIAIAEGRAYVDSIYPALFGIIAMIAFIWISGLLIKFAETRMTLGIRDEFRTAITEKRARLNYRYIEDNETWDLISRVSTTPELTLSTAYINLVSMGSLAIRIVGILVLLIAQVWWAALLILSFSIPLFILAIKSGRANYEASREVSKYKRKYGYLSEVLTGREAVDERTLFGYGEELNNEWHDQFETARKIEFKTEKKWFIKMKMGSILTALISTLIILVLLGPVFSGHLTVGMFISLVNAVFGLVQTMSWEFTNYMDQLAKHREYLKDLTEFAALEDTKGATLPPTATVPEFQSLEFKDVYFKYPGTDNYILEKMSFSIERGRHYAFVGINGAGKTTITKLITGLYDDFEGQIYINHRDIGMYSQAELKAFVSVVYQDFAKYYIDVGDNVALGNVNAIDDKGIEGRVLDAIDSVGLMKAVERLPEGIDTPLGKIVEGGQDISGGEWQRVAMARALLNPAPLRILDEPTAALDPISESRVYREFEQISRNKTTIFISHRLGSTKLADEIFVIGDGKVVERGTHEQLMELNGVYRDMYENQRSWYK